MWVVRSSSAALPSTGRGRLEARRDRLVPSAWVARDRKRHARARAPESSAPTRLPVDPSRLTMGNTYSAAPAFYEDRPFVCRGCGVAQTWTAAQQKWWYEDAGGYWFSTAIRCRACRAKERARIAEVRARSGHTR